MNAFHRFRVYHWLLAGLFILAYLTGDDAGLLHLWLGYGLIAVLAWRLLAMLLRLRGYPDMLPHRDGWARAGLGQGADSGHGAGTGRRAVYRHADGG